MNKVKIAGSVHSKLQLAANILGDRNLLYDTEENQLYVVYGNDGTTSSGLPKKKLNVVGCSVDNENIVTKDGKVALNDDIVCNTATFKPDDSGLSLYANKLLGQTVKDSITIIPLIKKSSIKQGAIAGEIYEKGEGISSSYHFSLASNGSRSLSGATSGNKKAFFVNLTVESETWIGIQFPSNISADIYFHGYDFRDTSLIPQIIPDLSYSDIKELAENIAATVTTTATLATWDFTTVPDGFADYKTNTDDAHKTFSFGSGLILTDTTKAVNISTNSKCSANDSIQGADNTGYIEFTNRTDNLDDKAFKLITPSDTVMTILYTSPTLGEDVSRTLTVYVKDVATGDYIPLSTTTTIELSEFSDGRDNETNTTTVVNYTVKSNDSTTTTTASTEDGVTKTTTTTVNTVVGNTITQGTTEVYYVYQLSVTSGTYYIGCNDSVRIWQISTIPAAYADKKYDSDGDFVTDQIENLPETGEDGTPYELSYSGLVLSKEDIIAITEKLKNKNRRITLNLSGSSTSWSNWDQNIFNGCNSLYSLSLPSGVNTLAAAFMFNNTNLHVFTVQSDFKGFNAVDVFSGASLQYMDLTGLDTSTWTVSTAQDFFANLSLRNTSNALEIWVTQSFLNLIKQVWGGSYWNNYNYIGHYSTDQFIVKG